MPSGSGLDLVDEAMRLYPALRCVIMSGHPRAAEAASAVTWLDKPLDIDQLLTTLAT